MDFVFPYLVQFLREYTGKVTHKLLGPVIRRLAHRTHIFGHHLVHAAHGMMLCQGPAWTLLLEKQPILGLRK